MEHALDILTLENAIHTIKENQTIVDYYLFNEYEIHLNTIPPHSKQEWHYHSQIEETLLIIEGTLTARWQENNETYQVDVQANSLIQVKQSVHTFTNETDLPVRFVVFRFVPEGLDKSEIIKKDKTIIIREED